jgi:hypothetical protein
MGDLEDLGASVAAQMEPPRTLWPGLQLAIDVLDVGATHDEHVHARGAARFDALAYRNGVGLAVRHRGAIPVEDQRLESLVRSHDSAVITRGHNPIVSASAAGR